MTAIMMASIGAAALTVSALDTTVTVGSDEWFSHPSEGDYFNYGYSAGPGTGTATDCDATGSIGDDTYTDGGATSRTVNHIYYAENSSPVDTGGLDDTIYFGLSGTSIPDTDTTFVAIIYNGQTYTRASADTYDPSEGGINTVWHWNSVSPDGPTSGTVDFEVVL